MLKELLKNTWIFSLLSSILAAVIAGMFLKVTDNDDETTRKSTIKVFVLVFAINAAILFWVNSNEPISSDSYFDAPR
jgi:dipeptide/tripeptide permease